MARYNGPVCRLCRREGMKLFLKGERCYTEKCAIEKRNVPPGQHGRSRKAKMVGYARAAAREAEGQAHLRRARGPVPRLLRTGRAHPRHHRRDAAAAARASPRQRGLPPRLRDVAAAGAPAGAPRPLPGQRQEGRHPVVLGQGRRRRRGARDAAVRTRRSCTRSKRSRAAACRSGCRSTARWKARSSRCRRASRSTCPCRNS